MKKAPKKKAKKKKSPARKKAVKIRSLEEVLAENPLPIVEVPQQLAPPPYVETPAQIKAKLDMEMRRGMGRPTDYTPELGTEIEIMLSNGMTLGQISKELGIARYTMLRWTAEEGHDFCDKYARGREKQADTWADEVIDISDDASYDWVERTFGYTTAVLADHEHIQRSKLRVDSRKWIASKLKPRKYSEKLITVDETPKSNTPTIFRVQWADEDEEDAVDQSTRDHSASPADPAAKEDK